MYMHRRGLGLPVHLLGLQTGVDLTFLRGRNSHPPGLPLAAPRKSSGVFLSVSLLRGVVTLPAPRARVPVASVRTNCASRLVPLLIYIGRLAYFVIYCLRTSSTYGISKRERCHRGRAKKGRREYCPEARRRSVYTHRRAEREARPEPYRALSRTRSTDARRLRSPRLRGRARELPGLAAAIPSNLIFIVTCATGARMRPALYQLLAPMRRSSGINAGPGFATDGITERGRERGLSWVYFRSLLPRRCASGLASSLPSLFFCPRT